MGAELFHADRQTDLTKLKIAFRYFANAPINTTHSEHIRYAVYDGYIKHPPFTYTNLRRYEGQSKSSRNCGISTVMVGHMTTFT